MVKIVYNPFSKEVRLSYKNGEICSDMDVQPFLELSEIIQKCKADSTLNHNSQKFMNHLSIQIKEQYPHHEKLDYYKKIKKTKNKRKHVEVAVIATMSSGKSTLLNAILGRELLPTRNEATTASITKIYKADEDQHLVRALDRQGEPITSWIEANLELMDAHNDDEEVHTTELITHLNISADEQVRLTLIDTPGPNNSQDATHQQATFEYLEQSKNLVILYVLNATQIGINDDAWLLRKLSKNYTQKNNIIFVLNKVDEIDPDKESVEQVVENVHTYLQHAGFDSPLIYPVTARAALELRQAMNGETLNRRVQRRLQTYQYLEEEYAIDSFLEEDEKKYIQSLAQNVASDYEKWLLATGLPALERRVEQSINNLHE